LRPRLVEWLDALLGTTAYAWLVPSPGVVYAAAILAVVVLLVRRGAAVGLDRYHLLGMSLWAILGGMVGARAFYLWQHLAATLADPAQVLDVTGGTASWGAYMGSLAGLLLYAGRYHLPVGPYADVAASVAGLGIAIGRWSCFLNGDDFGAVATLPWAVRFPHASMPFVAQVQAGQLDPLTDLSLPVHPVQLYLSANGLLLFGSATHAWRRLRAHPGATFCLYWLCYDVTRFGWEFLRADQVLVLDDHLTVPQVMAIITVVPALWGLWRSLHVGRVPVEIAVP